jgi:hypothetical protein
MKGGVEDPTRGIKGPLEGTLRGAAAVPGIPPPRSEERLE